ncbi:MAG: hypothetical protein ACETVM_04250 [Candidatus Bathyarchaeia archaeon]
MRKKRKRRKKKFILLFFVGVVIVVAVIALYQSLRDRPRYTAEEYFEISDVTWRGGMQDNGSSLILNILTFNITAVEGDAHQVRIQNLGIPEPGSEMWWEPWVDLGTMSQGEAETVQLITEKGLFIHLKEEGYPVKVRIISEEISKYPRDQSITIFVTEEEQVHM